MKKCALIGILLSTFLTGACQSTTTQPAYNFDFEVVRNSMPVGWTNNSNNTYRQSLDSITPHSGKYAAVLEFTGGDPSFGTWTFAIPENFPGKQITFSGYIKTQDVEGYAGLWMRIDPQVAFNNMSQEGISGTTDWTRYEFTLDMNPGKTERIVLGALLAGKGKMWVDNLKVTIDGKDISTVAPLEKEPAKRDTEFDRGSSIELPALSADQQENLKILGLVWGFVKYYHPTVGSGKVNWDYELFRVLPSVVGAADAAQRDEVLLKWISQLGPVSKGGGAPEGNVKMTPDLEWITESGFSEELTAMLCEIREAERPDKHYYIGQVPNVGNPEFRNEAAYERMDPDDDGMRLLALFRYWNMIQYFFPYKYLIEEDWKDVLAEFVPKFAEAGEQEKYVLALLELIARIHDTHASIRNHPLLNAFFGARHAAVDVYFVEGRPVVTDYRHGEWGRASGLRLGDVITAVNGKQVADRIRELQPYVPASNRRRQLQEIGPSLVRSNDSTLRLDVLRDGKPLSLEVPTYPGDKLTFNNPFYVETINLKIFDDNIAYINNASFDAKDLPVLWERIRNRKGLIIDARNYPRHFPIHELSAYLMGQPIPFVSFSVGNVQQPGLFVMNTTLSAGAANGKHFDGKVVILVNEMSLSSAEYHAMAYRVHPNATVMGTPTAGADGNVSPIMLPGGIRTGISGIGIYYPDGGETQRVGIVPDITVEPTIQGIKDRHDEVLTNAIALINGK